MTLRCEAIKKIRWVHVLIICSPSNTPLVKAGKKITSSKNFDMWKQSLGAGEEMFWKVFPALTVTVGGSLCSHSSSCRSRSFPSSPASPASAGRGLRGARLGSAGRDRALTHLLTAGTAPSHNHLGGKGPPDICSGSASSRLSQLETSQVLHATHSSVPS